MLERVQQTGIPRAVVTRPSGARKPRARRRHTSAWLAALPPAVAVLIVVGYPIVDGFRLSFSDWPGVGDVRFSGIGNYREIIENPAIVSSAVLTVIYAFACAFGIVAVASLLAAAVSGGVRGSRFYRVVWFLPGVAPATAVAVFWQASMQPRSGAVNVVLGSLGLGNAHAWLADPATAIYPVVFVAIWTGVGFAFLLLLGAMEQIPVSVYEAAQIDGANRGKQFVSITLPLVRPVLMVVFMLSFIAAANGFSTVYAMTKGGPANSTMTLPIYVYQEAFVNNNYGPASAVAIVSGICLMLIGAVCLKLGRSGQEASR